MALLISITATNKIQETTLRKSCYYDNYKVRFSMTKHLATALRNTVNIRKKSKYEAISVSKRVLTFPFRGYATKF